MEMKWMECPHCKKCVLHNMTGTCLACQRTFAPEEQPDSWENLHRCRRCSRKVSLVGSDCGICEDTESGLFNPTFPQKELLKCRKCGWIHFIVEKGGLDNCFSCGRKAERMIKINESEAPKGCTLQPVNRGASA